MHECAFFAIFFIKYLINIKRRNVKLEGFLKSFFFFLAFEEQGEMVVGDLMRGEGSGFLCYQVD